MCVKFKELYIFFQLWPDVSWYLYDFYQMNQWAQINLFQ